jgi:hypothetical protein
MRPDLDWADRNGGNVGGYRSTLAKKRGGPGRPFDWIAWRSAWADIVAEAVFLAAPLADREPARTMDSGLSGVIVVAVGTVSEAVISPFALVAVVMGDGIADAPADLVQFGRVKIAHNTSCGP